MSLNTFVTSALLVVFPLGAHAQEHEHGGASEKLGTVHFATSCSAAAQPQFDRAVALLHSFEFPRAIEGFGQALKTDPTCAIADWGIAVARWTNPFAAGIRGAAILQQGRETIEQARTIGPKTDRERAYVEAVAKLYIDTD